MSTTLSQCLIRNLLIAFSVSVNITIDENTLWVIVTKVADKTTAATYYMEAHMYFTTEMVILLRRTRMSRTSEDAVSGLVLKPATIMLFV